MADYLPQEILFDIFTRLSVKTILICNSVCKSWHSLIKNPNFINFHLNRPRNLTYNNAHDLLLVRTCSVETKEELYSLHCDDEAFDEYAKLHFPFDRSVIKYYRIVGSCNGVLCLTDDHISYMYNTILWNPTIRKWVRLPRPRVTFSSHGGYDHAIGFGYDAKSSDYKVVRIVYLLDDYDNVIPPEVDVYTLSTGTWRNISHLRLRYMIDAKVTQAYFNGASHWIRADMKRHRFLLVSFHMDDEVFRYIKPPADVPFYWPCLHTPFVFQGSLSLVEQKETRCENCWCIWVMKEYGVASSWTKQLQVDIHKGMDRLIGFRNKGELLIAAEREFIAYDPEAAQVKELGIRSCAGSRYQYSFHADSYIESLVLLGSQLHVEENGDDSEEEEEGVKKRKRMKMRVKKKNEDESEKRTDKRLRSR